MKHIHLPALERAEYCEAGREMRTDIADLPSGASVAALDVAITALELREVRDGVG